ncbi:peptidase U32 family protein [Acetonema longum]|uniref:Peptidase U32 n=1 Tax=Acetonema longum DSM 6540 TaxID=1009370 RepID=F7NQ59_9FIRM|nr:U32 family peptidase [Acetonema longum]EGO61818.1 peptidase U32 [Acetonema longum DSM 6540]
MDRENSVELLAPVGTWDMLESTVAAGADAVYLGGKLFNMRLHRADTNFDEDGLVKVIDYAHGHQTRVYITVNNLISDQELPRMRSYLSFLNEARPDALIVQDLAVLQLVREMGLDLELHASVMMNTHNEHAVRTLMEYGIKRVVTNREMSFSQLTLLKERTGVDLEYFIHGDMCIAQSGQCYHSGILFGQSSNRGRCLKPCRWPFRLIDGASVQELPVTSQQGPYKLAMKDMCLYLYLPELIRAGVCSFKIEGRMRTADFASRIVRQYRRAIDRYLADPVGYSPDPVDWQDLYDNRSRDFSPCYALGNPGASSIGYDGKREPRFFSQAVVEAGLAPIYKTSPEASLPPEPQTKPTLTVRVADMPSIAAACQNGASLVIIGGEAFQPAKPWTVPEILQGLEIVKAARAQLFITTPRITTERECAELERFFAALPAADGVMVSNLGSLRLAQKYTDLPIYADYSFNIFNQQAIEFLKGQDVRGITPSIESSCGQMSALAQGSPLPLMPIVHGPLEAMVLDHCLLNASFTASSPQACHSFCRSKSSYALLDSAGEKHPIAIDQYGRNHLLFAKDLCLFAFLPELFANGITRFRIEGQHYSPTHIAAVTAYYRQELDKLAANPAGYSIPADYETRLKGPRQLGLGAFRYKMSK